MSLNNHPTKNQNPEAVPRQEVKTSLPTEETTPVEEEAQRAIDDRNLLLDCVEELGGYEALGVSPDAPFATLHDAVMVAQAERDELEADRRSRGEAGRRLGEIFVGSILRGLHDTGRGTEARQRSRIRDEEQEVQRTERTEKPDELTEEANQEEPLSDFFRAEAERLGLDPDTATKDDIFDEYRKKDAEELGLDPDATNEEIQDERQRRDAEKLGLPSDATDEDIADARRARVAGKAGLGSDASWDEISEAQNEQRNQAIRNVLGLDPEAMNEGQMATAILGIDPNTSRDELERIAKTRAMEFCERNGIDLHSATTEQIFSALGIDPDTATVQEILQAMKDNGVLID